MNAFSLTKDDLEIVLNQHSLSVSEEQTESWRMELDQSSVEDAALEYTDFDEQVQAALDDIWTQLKDMGAHELARAQNSKAHLNKSLKKIKKPKSSKKKI